MRRIANSDDMLSELIDELSAPKKQTSMDVYEHATAVAFVKNLNDEQRAELYELAQKMVIDIVEDSIDLESLSTQEVREYFLGLIKKHQKSH